MQEIAIPIVTGPGTQPAEVDGAELDILQLPSGMDTYESPVLPEPEDVTGLDAAKQCLARLQEALNKGEGADPVALDGLDDANRQLIDQVLGEGEVSIRFEGRVRARMQESVLAGVWRVRVVGDNEAVLSDTIEVGAVPRLLREQAFVDAFDGVDGEIDELPEGVLNAPSLLTEINDKVATFDASEDAHVVNLTLLPQTEQDLAFLDERLGEGPVTILSRGYGNCRITSTATNHVWWVQYFNSQDRNILNTLEVTTVPTVACAAPEDISDSASRLSEILEVYR